MLPILELTHDLVGNVGWFAADIDNDRVLVRCGLLQCREPAVERGYGHEVLVPCNHALVDQFARSLHVDERHVVALADDDDADTSASTS